MLIVPKKDSLEGKLSTVCYARLIFSCGEIIIENIHSWVSKLLPLDVKEKILFCFIWSIPSRFKQVTRSVIWAYMSNTTRSVSISFYIWFYAAFHPPTCLSTSEEQKEETEVSHILFDYCTSYSYISYIFILLVKIRHINEYIDRRLELINSIFVMLGY